jgi:AcrR family transcriptional regulator
MDEIAASTRVTKRTLYYHFRSKDSLLAAVLDAQHHMALAAFRTFGYRLSGSPEDIIDALFRELAVWSDWPRWASVSSAKRYHACTESHSCRFVNRLFQQPANRPPTQGTT